MVPREKIEEIHSISCQLQQVDLFQKEGNLIMAANLLEKIAKVLRSETSTDSIQIQKLMDKYEECRIRLTKAMTKDIPDSFLK